MVRFGKIISIDFKNCTATIRENTPAGTEFVILPSEFMWFRMPNLYAEVTFKKDREFVLTNVAMSAKVLRRGRAA